MAQGPKISSLSKPPEVTCYICSYFVFMTLPEDSPVIAVFGKLPIIKNAVC